MKTSIAALILAAAPLATAQGPNPLTTDAKLMWNSVKTNIQRAAEKMPEEHYSFQPTAEVRTFGQIVGHIADGNFMICAAANDEKRDPPNVEKTKTTKADLVAALKESSDYCDAAFAAMTDAKAAGMVKFFGRERTRLSVFNFNTGHDFEHYGNLVTYMRIKGIVPPSSEGR